MTHIDNRPERCGVMRGALSTLQIDLDSALKFYTDPKYHGLLLQAVEEAARYAQATLAGDRELVEANARAFEAHLAAQQDTAAGGGEF